MSTTVPSQIFRTLHDVILYAEVGRLTQRMLSDLLEHPNTETSDWPQRVAPPKQETAGEPATLYQLRTLMAQLACGLVTEQDLNRLLHRITTKDVCFFPSSFSAEIATRAEAAYRYEASDAYQRKAREAAAHNAEVLRRRILSLDHP